MSKFKPQFRRLLYIDEQLKKSRRQWLREQSAQTDMLGHQPHFPNCSSLGEALEVSPKTIQRDLQFLRDEQGAPIDYDNLRRGYYYTEDNFTLPGMQVSESDLFAICIAERALAQYNGTPLHDRLASIFDRIAASLPERISVPAPWIESRISFRQPPPRQLQPKVWQTVARCLHECRGLNIDYQSPGKRRQPRRVDPYHMINHRGDWYLIAQCHRTDEIRVFAMSRITEAVATRVRFEIPDDFDPQHAFANSFGIFRGDESHDVQIRFTAKAAPYVKERTWKPGQKLKENRDGSVVLSLQVTDLREIASWTLSWGPQARVLEPKALAEHVARELRIASQQYE